MRLLFLTTHPTLAGRVLLAAQAMNAKVVIVSNGDSCLRHSRYCMKHLIMPFPCADASIEPFQSALAQIVESNQVDVIVPIDVQAELVATRLQQTHLGAPMFPLAKIDAIECLANKWRFYQFALTLSLTVPETYLIAHTDDGERLARSALQYPLIAKPLDAQGGEGVERLDCPADLYRRVRSAQRDKALPIIVQRYIDGEDLDISLLCTNGNVHAWAAHSHPSPDVRQFVTSPCVFHAAERIVHACTYSGVINMDFRVERPSGQCYVIEANPRFWTTVHVSAWHGVNFLELGCRISVGDQLGAVVTAEPGSYRLHKRLALDILRLRNLRDVSRGNWAGFAASLLDPLPLLMGAC